MTSPRYEDIREKLGFAFLKLRVLNDELHKARIEETSVEFIGQKVGEILSACRECFDYCARDICEAFVANVPNQVYFPFTMESLARSPWVGIKLVNPGAYQQLENLSTKVAANKAMPGSIFGYKLIREVNTLVNDKKHDCITRVQRPENASTLIDFGDGQTMVMSPVFPFDGAVPDFGASVQAESMIGNHYDIQIKYISEYHLLANDWEAGRYCMHAVHSSWRVLDDLYASIFGTNRCALDPAETTKSLDQKEFEALLRRASPIVTRLGVIGVFNDDIEIERLDISFEGIVSRSDPDSHFIAGYFRDAFYAHGWSAVRQQFDEVFKCGGLARAESQRFEPRYMEIDLRVNSGFRTLTLPSGRVLSFNRTVWGLLTKFQCNELDTFHPSGGAMKRAVELYGLTSKTVVGENPLGSSRPRNQR